MLSVHDKNEFDNPVTYLRLNISQNKSQYGIACFAAPKDDDTCQNTLCSCFPTDQSFYFFLTL